MHHTSQIVDVLLAFNSFCSPSLRCPRKGLVALWSPSGCVHMLSCAWSAPPLHWSALSGGPLLSACGPQTGASASPRSSLEMQTPGPPWTLRVRMCSQTPRWFVCTLTLENYRSRKLWKARWFNCPFCVLQQHLVFFSLLTLVAIELIAQFLVCLSYCIESSLKGGIICELQMYV